MKKDFYFETAEERFIEVHEFNGIDFKGKYSISNFGNLRNNMTGKLLKAVKTGKSKVYTLCQENQLTRTMPAKLVVECFYNITRKDYSRIHYIDGNKDNWRLDNLQVF